MGPFRTVEQFIDKAVACFRVLPFKFRTRGVCNHSGHGYGRYLVPRLSGRGLWLWHAAQSYVQRSERRADGVRGGCQLCVGGVVMLSGAGGGVEASLSV